MMRVSVQADINAIMAQFEQIKDPKPAVSRAINKTMTTARAKTAQAIRAVGYNIKAGDIKKSLSTSRRATRQLLVAYLDARGRPIPLIKYGATEQRRAGGGVSVNVLNGRKLIQGAFVATMPNGHKGVFVRVGSAAHQKVMARKDGIRAGRKGSKHRDSSGHGLPILELFGPAIPSAFKHNTVQGKMVAIATARFPVVLKQELNFLALKSMH